MNRQEQDNNFERAMKHINTEGLDGMGSAIQLLINAAMEIERKASGSVSLRENGRAHWIFKWL